MLRWRYRRLLWKGSVIGIGVIIVVLIAALIAMIGREELVAGVGVEMVEFEGDPLGVKGYTKVKVGLSPEKMYLVDGWRAVVMVTSRGRAYTIQRGMEGVLESRPDVYDVVFDVL